MLHMQPKSLFHITLLFAASLLFLLSGQVFAQDLIIENYELVGGEWVGRTDFEYTYTANLMNTGPALQNVTATVMSISPNTVLVDGTLTFGNVPADSYVRSSSLCRE